MTRIGSTKRGRRSRLQCLYYSAEISTKHLHRLLRSIGFSAAARSYYSSTPRPTQTSTALLSNLATVSDSPDRFLLLYVQLSKYEINLAHAHESRGQVLINAKKQNLMDFLYPARKKTSTSTAMYFEEGFNSQLIRVA